MATDLIATFGGGGGEKPPTSFNSSSYLYRDWQKPRGGIYNGGYTALTDLVNVTNSGGGYLETLSYSGNYNNQGNVRFVIIIDGTTLLDKTFSYISGNRAIIIPSPAYDNSVTQGNAYGYDTMSVTTKIRFDSSLRIRVDTPTSSGNYIFWNYYLT